MNDPKSPSEMKVRKQAWIEEAEMLAEAEAESREVEAVESDLDDSLDGDAASALASAGFGTDEDYGCFDDGE